MKLEQVQVIFRHGARTPLSFWSRKKFENFRNFKPEVWNKNELLKVIPSTNVKYSLKLADGREPFGYPIDRHDENANHLLGGCSFGQLTCLGQQQLYDLGKWISQRYTLDQQFISPSYNKNEVYVRTSYYERTIQSVVCLLGGLYGDESFHEPVHIVTKLSHKEDLAANCEGCTKFIKWYRYKMSDEARSPQDEDLHNEMNYLMGNRGDPVSLMSVNDLIQCRKAHGIFVPDYLLEREALIAMSASSTLQEILGFGSVHRIKNSIGSFLETICSQLYQSVADLSDQKLLLYSAHDWTILSMLIALGVDVKNDRIPPFASNIILELYRKEDSRRYLRILYNGKPLLLNPVKEIIPLEKFMDLVNIYRVEDWDKDCGNVMEN